MWFSLFGYTLLAVILLPFIYLCISNSKLSSIAAKHIDSVKVETELFNNDYFALLNLSTTDLKL